MSKNYQKAARGWLYALAVVIAGTCFGASPAQSATCFLPSGECSTGKIGAGPSGGESTPEYCIGYDITEKEYNAKYSNTSCFSCSSPCTKTSGGTFYKCETVDHTTWYDKYNVCCTNDTKYDDEDGKCCAGGKCDHPCSGGKQWSPTLKDCVCPSNVETDSNGNCCEVGQVLENGACTTPCSMNDCGDYPYTSDPGNSESCDLGCGKGLRYKCQDGYTYSGGKCVEQCAASGYTLTSEKDSHCYSCSTCPTNSSKYKCTENVQTGYQLVDGVCSKIPETEPDPITCPSGYSASISCATENGFTLFEHPNYAGCYQCQCRNQGQIDGKCTNCSAEGYTQTQTSGYVCTDACPIDSNLFKPSSCTCTATCPDGYSFSIPTIGSCGSSAGVANGGWSFDSKTVCGKTCGKCSKNSCPAGTSTNKNQVCVGGQSLTFSGKYSGDDSCMSCEGCPTGYSTRYQSVTDCGTQGSNGWNFTTSGTSSGQKCGKCTAKSCPSGYQTGTPSCTSQSANKIPYGYNYSGTYSGDESCKKCKYRYRYTCSDNGLVNVGGGCGLKVCDYNCGYTYCNYSTRSDRQYTTFQGACYEYTPGPTEWYVED